MREVVIPAVRLAPGVDQGGPLGAGGGESPASSAQASNPTEGPGDPVTAHRRCARSQAAWAGVWHVGGLVLPLGR